jgi:hypothetical protein
MRGLGKSRPAGHKQPTGRRSYAMAFRVCGARLPRPDRPRLPVLLPPTGGNVGTLPLILDCDYGAYNFLSADIFHATRMFAGQHNMQLNKIVIVTCDLTRPSAAS